MVDPDRAALTLADVRVDDATRQRVEQIAASMDEGDGSRLEAEIGNRRVEVMPLVVKLLNVEPDMVRRRQAVDLLHALRFHLIGEDSPAEIPAKADEPQLPAADQSDPLAVADVTPQLAVRLQRYAGNWVALQDGGVLGADPSLSSLIDAIGDAESTVLFVPPRGANREVQE